MVQRLSPRWTVWRSGGASVGAGRGAITGTGAGKGTGTGPGGAPPANAAVPPASEAITDSARARSIRRRTARGVVRSRALTNPGILASLAARYRPVVTASHEAQPVATRRRTAATASCGGVDASHRRHADGSAPGVLRKARD